MYNLISSMGGASHNLFHGILSIPKATVTSAKIRRSQMLSKTISSGWPKFHNFLDLGRNSILIQLKFGITTCHNYTDLLANFGIPKFRIQKVIFSKVSHFNITFGISTLDLYCYHTFKPPWPNFLSSEILFQFTDRAAISEIMKFRIKKAIFSKVTHFDITLWFSILEFYHNQTFKQPWPNFPTSGRFSKLTHRGNSCLHRTSQQLPLIPSHLYRLHSHWFYSCYSDIRFNNYLRTTYHESSSRPSLGKLSKFMIFILWNLIRKSANSSANSAIADIELVMCDVEDLAREDKPFPRLTTVKHRQSDEQLSKVQAHIVTARTCLVTTCQQLGTDISDYIHEE